MIWKMHGILVTINLLGLGFTIALICIIRVSTGITGPHIPFGLSFCNPFCQHFSGTSSLGNSEGKYTTFEGIAYTRHRANQWITVRGIRNGAIDYVLNSGCTK